MATSGRHGLCQEFTGRLNCVEIKRSIELSKKMSIVFILLI